MAIEIKPPKRDEPRLDRPSRGLGTLLRALGWGSAAAIALIALAFTAQTGTGSERLREVYAALGNGTTTTAVAAVPRDAEREAEIRTLETQVRTLGADRERLVARLAKLERDLDDMTGSIAKQAAQPAAPQAAAPAPEPPPTVARVASAPATVMPKYDPLEGPVLRDTEYGWPADASDKDEPIAEPTEQSDAQTIVPLPPPRFIAAPAMPHEPPPLPLPQFGVEIAAAPSMEQLRARWVLLKANYGPLLGSLQPIALRHVKAGGLIEYKLVAGPLANLSAARQLCARFTDARAGCRATKFNAEQVVQQ